VLPRRLKHLEAKGHEALKELLEKKRKKRPEMPGRFW